MSHTEHVTDLVRDDRGHEVVVPARREERVGAVRGVSRETKGDERNTRDPDRDRAFANVGAQGSHTAVLAFLRTLPRGKNDHHLRKSVELSHLSLGLELARRGRYDEALASLGRALELDPNYADAHGIVGWTYLQQGKRTEAVAAFETCARLSHDSPGMVARLAHAYGLVGRSDDARMLLRSLEQQARTERISPILFAQVYAGLGDFDRAFEQLEEAVARRQFLRLNGDPLLVPLYKDPRFVELGRRFRKTTPCP